MLVAVDVVLYVGKDVRRERKNVQAKKRERDEEKRIDDIISPAYFSCVRAGILLLVL